MIRVLLLAALAFGFSSSSFSQEKKIEKKKPAAKKKAEKAPSQDWGRFNAGAKKDLEKIEKKDAKGKAK